VGCGLWVVGCGLWVVGCGLWVVGCGLWVAGVRTARAGSERPLLPNNYFLFFTATAYFSPRQGWDGWVGLGEGVGLVDGLNCIFGKFMLFS
jgi:hypothetical protein